MAPRVDHTLSALHTHRNRGRNIIVEFGGLCPGLDHDIKPCAQHKNNYRHNKEEGREIGKERE